jgi:hypothetical protein
MYADRRSARMVVILPAFDPRVTVPNTLSGGVNTSNRALLLAQGTAQTQAAQSLNARFTARIENALGRLANSSSAEADALLRAQSQLASRKDRVTQAVQVVSKALTQSEYLKGHIEYLQDQLDELEAGNTTAGALATDWDNKLRKINQLASAASQIIKDGRSYYPKNLIDSRSRETFSAQTVYAPYNSDGDVIQIDGTYLGTDWYITDSSGDFWNSDTGFAASEDAVGTLTGYDDYPDTANGESSSVDAAGLFVSFNSSTDAVSFQVGATTYTGTVTRGGLGLLDAFLYDNFETDVDPNSIDRARTDLQDAEALLLNTEAELRTSLATLQSRTTVFDSLISAADIDVTNLLRNLQSEREAEVLSAQLEYTVASFDFTLLAARGNTLIRSLVIAQDNTQNNPWGDTTASGEFVLGAAVNLVA